MIDGKEQREIAETEGQTERKEVETRREGKRW